MTHLAAKAIKGAMNEVSLPSNFPMSPEVLVALISGLIFYLAFTVYLMRKGGFLLFLGICSILFGVFALTIGAPGLLVARLGSQAQAQAEASARKAEAMEAIYHQQESEARSHTYSQTSDNSSNSSTASTYQRTPIVDDVEDYVLEQAGFDPNSEEAQAGKKINNTMLNPFSSSEDQLNTIEDSIHSVLDR